MRDGYTKNRVSNLAEEVRFAAQKRISSGGLDFDKVHVSDVMCGVRCFS